VFKKGGGYTACTLTSSAVESRLCSLSADTLDELNDRSNKLDSADTSGWLAELESVTMNVQACEGDGG